MRLLTLFFFVCIHFGGYAQFLFPEQKEVEQLFAALIKNNVKEMKGVMKYDSTVFTNDTSTTYTTEGIENILLVDAKAGVLKVINGLNAPDYESDCTNCKYPFEKLYKFDTKGRLIMEYGKIFREYYLECHIYNLTGSITETYRGSNYIPEEEFYQLPADNPKLWPVTYLDKFYYNDSGILTKNVLLHYEAGKWAPKFTYFFKVSRGMKDSLTTYIYKEYHKKDIIDQTTTITYDSNGGYAYFHYELHSLYKGGVSRTKREWLYTREKNKERIQFEDWDIFDIEKKDGPSVKETTINFYENDQLPVSRRYMKVDTNLQPYVIEKTVVFTYLQ